LIQPRLPQKSGPPGAYGWTVFFSPNNNLWNSKKKRKK
jgi:hypothetical protein